MESYTPQDALLADELRRLLRAQVQRGHFVGKSGRSLEAYVDCRQVTLSARGFSLVGQVLADRLASLPFDALGGPALSACPLVDSTMAVLYYSRSPLQPYLSGFYVRSEPKEHGAEHGELIVGPVSAGQRVVLLDDVVTSGISLDWAYQQAMRYGLDVVKVLVLVDRGGCEWLRDRDVPIEALYTLTELL